MSKRRSARRPRCAFCKCVLRCATSTGSCPECVEQLVLPLPAVRGPGGRYVSLQGTWTPTNPGPAPADADAPAARLHLVAGGER